MTRCKEHATLGAGRELYWVLHLDTWVSLIAVVLAGAYAVRGGPDQRGS